MNLVGRHPQHGVGRRQARRAGRSRGSRRPVSRYFTPHQPPASIPASARNEPGARVETPLRPWPTVQPKARGSAAAHERAAQQVPAQISGGGESLDAELAAQAGHDERSQRRPGNQRQGERRPVEREIIDGFGLALGQSGRQPAERYQDAQGSAGGEIGRRRASPRSSRQNVSSAAATAMPAGSPHGANGIAGAASVGGTRLPRRPPLPSAVANRATNAFRLPLPSRAKLRLTQPPACTMPKPNNTPPSATARSQLDPARW